MDLERLRDALHRYRDGTLDEQRLLERLAELPFELTGDAAIDHHRALRTGVPEVVFAPGKTPEQVTEILRSLAQQHDQAMATRVDETTARHVLDALSDAVYFPTARIMALGTLRKARPPAGMAATAEPERTGTTPAADAGDAADPVPVLVVSAGTSDLPVAEEAAVTAELLGWDVVRVRDVGVAGLHRLLARLPLLRRARVIVCVAGMEGALPGVVAGLVAAPVIGVPTSVGYGTALGGAAPLLTMLNSCAPGVAVVNVDNGYGAARMAHAILTQASQGEEHIS